MKKIILLTGFEPFNKETINPSWEAVRSLQRFCSQASAEQRLRAFFEQPWQAVGALPLAASGT